MLSCIQLVSNECRPVTVWYAMVHFQYRVFYKYRTLCIPILTVPVHTACTDCNSWCATVHFQYRVFYRYRTLCIPIFTGPVHATCTDQYGNLRSWLSTYSGLENCLLCTGRFHRVNPTFLQDVQDPFFMLDTCESSLFTINYQYSYKILKQEAQGDILLSTVHCERRSNFAVF